MKQFLPFANAIDKNGKEQKLMTYDGCDDIESCLKQFDIWENDYRYKIKTATVQIIETGKPLKTVYYEKRWVECE